jgi:hypothetical protein
MLRIGLPCSEAICAAGKLKPNVPCFVSLVELDDERNSDVFDVSMGRESASVGLVDSVPIGIRSQRRFTPCCS